MRRPLVSETGAKPQQPLLQLRQKFSVVGFVKYPPQTRQGQG